MKNQEIIPVPKEQVYEKPAKSNFGRLLQHLTERHAQKTTTDLGTVEWSEYPIDQMVSEALLAIVAKLAQTHKLQISTQRKIEKILPRLSYNLELGIVLNGGPEAVGERFEREVIPQIEAEIAKLTEDNKVTPQKLWQLPVARLLIGLINDVKRTAAELEESVSRLEERDVGRINAHKIGIDGVLLDGRLSIQRALDWKTEDFRWPTSETQVRDQAYVETGKDRTFLEQLRLSACEKLPVNNPGEMPWEVVNGTVDAPELEAALTTQYALFLIGKRATYLSADDLQDAFKKSEMALEDEAGNRARFEEHLQKMFRLTRNEIQAVGAELKLAMHCVSQDSILYDVGRYNRIWYHPYKGKLIEGRIARLTELGCSQDKALKIIKKADKGKRGLEDKLNDYMKTGRVTLKDMLTEIHLEFRTNHAAEMLYMMENLSPEDFRTALLRLGKDSEDPLVKRKLREIAGKPEEEGLTEMERFMVLVKKLVASEFTDEEEDGKKKKDDGKKDKKEDEQKHDDEKGKNDEEGEEDESENDDDKDHIEKKLLKAAANLDPEELDAAIQGNHRQISNLFMILDVWIQKKGYADLLEKIKPATLEKIILGVHVLFREGEYVDLDQVDGIHEHSLPWTRQADEPTAELRILDNGEGRLERAMKNNSEKDIFYWLYDKSKKVGELWKEYDAKRKKFYAKVRSVEKKFKK